MKCNICSTDILFSQLRHSDGTGNYHVVCEFNQIRHALGMPDFETVRRVKYYAPDFVPVSSPRVHLNLQHQTKFRLAREILK